MLQDLRLRRIPQLEDYSFIVRSNRFAADVKRRGLTEIMTKRFHTQYAAVKSNALEVVEHMLSKALKGLNITAGKCKIFVLRGTISYIVL